MDLDLIYFSVNGPWKTNGEKNEWITGGLSRLLDTKHKRLLFKMNSSYELYSATMKKIVD